MTLQEFNTEFDVLYNNISSGAAPGLNKYEKSLLLTNAQESIIKAYYSGDINKLIPGFEENERRRRELSELVQTYSTELTESKNTIVNDNLENKKIDSKSVFFVIPCDILYILYERAVAHQDPCIDEDPCTGEEIENILKVVPIKLDLYNIQIDNPFRRPDKKYAWRLDIESDRTNPVIELVYLGYPIKSYYMRYVLRPHPIILTNFEEDSELEGMDLTIGDLNIASDCTVQSLDKEILQLAVNTAILRYRENSLENIKNF